MKEKNSTVQRNSVNTRFRESQSRIKETLELLDIVTVTEDLLGRKDGNNKTFKSSQNFIDSTVRVFQNGLLLFISDDYALIGNRTVVLNEAVEEEDFLTINYQAAIYDALSQSL